MLLLIFIQPDLGTSIIFSSIWLGWSSSLASTGATCSSSPPSSLPSCPSPGPSPWPDYQIERISVLLNAEEDPLDAGYNPIQSQIAVGSGQLFGKGLTNGEQTQLDFLKVKTKDFIFSVLGEELGFVGAMALFASSSCY